MLWKLKRPKLLLLVPRSCQYFVAVLSTLNCSFSYLPLEGERQKKRSWDQHIGMYQCTEWRWRCLVPLIRLCANVLVGKWQLSRILSPPEIKKGFGYQSNYFSQNDDDVYPKKRTYDICASDLWCSSLQGLMVLGLLMRRKAVRRTSSRRCHTALLTIKAGLWLFSHVRKIMKLLLVLIKKLRQFPNVD